MPLTGLLLNAGGGAFAANAVPHLVHGLSGQRFRTPFVHLGNSDTSPAGLNVLWGWANAMVAWALVVVTDFQPAAFAIGALVAGLGLAAIFSRG